MFLLESKKRKRILESSSSSDSSSSSSSSGSDSDNFFQPRLQGKRASYKIPRKTRWSPEEIQSFKDNFPVLKNFPNSVLENLSFKDMASLECKRNKNSKFSSHQLANNFEKLKKFPTKIHEGLDDCTGKVHSARFLRGYVASTKDLWLQARESLPLEGLDPVSNYDTGSIGITGKITPLAWKEIHNPSSKDLSIRLFSPAATKSTWKGTDSNSHTKDFSNMQELRVAISTLDAAFHKVLPWNFSVKAISVFLQNINFGGSELSESQESVQFVADFVDEALKTNAQFWDERRGFLSYQHLHTRWVSAMAERGSQISSETKKKKVPGELKSKGEGRSQGGGGEKKPGERFPFGCCKNYNLSSCPFKSDHPAPWSKGLTLNHSCAYFLQEKNRFCFGNHPKFEHK